MSDDRIKIDVELEIDDSNLTSQIDDLQEKMNIKIDPMQIIKDVTDALNKANGQIQSKVKPVKVPFDSDVSDYVKSANQAKKVSSDLEKAHLKTSNVIKDVFSGASKETSTYTNRVGELITVTEKFDKANNLLGRTVKTAFDPKQMETFGLQMDKIKNLSAEIGSQLEKTKHADMLGIDSEKLKTSLNGVKKELDVLSDKGLELQRSYNDVDFNILKNSLSGLEKQFRDITKETKEFDKIIQGSLAKQQVDSLYGNLKLTHGDSFVVTKKQIDEATNQVVAFTGEVRKATGEYEQFNASIKSDGTLKFSENLKINQNEIDKLIAKQLELAETFNRLKNASSASRRGYEGQEYATDTDVQRIKDLYNAFQNLERQSRGLDTSLSGSTDRVEELSSKAKELESSFEQWNLETTFQKSQAEIRNFNREVEDLRSQFQGKVSMEFFDEANENIKKITYSFNDAVGVTQKFVAEVNEATGQLNTDKSFVIDDKARSEFNSAKQNITEGLDELRITYEKTVGSFRGEDISRLGLTEGIEEARQKLNLLNEEAKQLDIGDPNSAGKLSDIKQEVASLSKTINGLQADFDKLETEYEQNEIAMVKYSSKLSDLESKHSKFIPPESLSRIESLRVALSNTNLSLEDQRKILQDVSRAYEEVSAQAKQSESNQSGFGKMVQGFKNFAPKSLALSTMYKLVNAISDSMREAVRAVVEMDTAMVELKKVTSETEGTYERFLSTATQVGRNVGRTGKEVVEATADFARMGFNLKEATGLAEQALTMINVGDGIDKLEDASKSIISTLKVFSVEGEDVVTQAKRINDVYNEVSNNFAVETGDLAEGVRRSAAVLKSSGNSFEEVVGILAGGNEIVQNMNRLSTNLNTVSQRIKSIQENAKTGALEWEQEDTFKRAGVQLLDLNGSLRSTYDILVDLAKVYPTLDDATRSFITQELAGKRASVYLESVLLNMPQVEAAVNAAKNSAGSAMIEQDKYLDSIRGKLAKVKANLVSWVTSLNLDGLFKGVLDVLDKFTGGIDYGLNIFSGNNLSRTIAQENEEISKTANLLDVVENKLSTLNAFSEIDSGNSEEIKMAWTEIVSLLPAAAGYIDHQNMSFAEQKKAVADLVVRERELLELRRKQQAEANKTRIENELKNIEKQIGFRTNDQNRLQALSNTDPRLQGLSAHKNDMRSTERSIARANELIWNSYDAIINMGGIVPVEILEKMGIGTGEVEVIEDVSKVIQQLYIEANKGGDEGLFAIHEIMDYVNKGAISLEEAMVGLSLALEGDNFSAEQLQDLANTFPGLMDILDTKVVDEMANQFDALSSSISGLNGILESYHHNGELSLDNVATLISKYPEMLDYVEEEGGKYVLTTGYLEALKLKQDEYKASIDEVLQSKIAHQETNATEQQATDIELQNLDQIITKQQEYATSLQSTSQQDELAVMSKEALAQSNVNVLSSINELNTQLSDGTITMSQYISQLRESMGQLNFDAMVDPQTLANTLTILQSNVTNAITSMANGFAQGKVSVSDFNSGLKESSNFLIELSQKASMLSGIADSTSELGENINILSLNLNTAVENFSDLSSLMETFEEFGTVIDEGMVDGVAKFTDVMVKADGFKEFQSAFQEQILMLRETAPSAWDDYVNHIATSMGISKDEAALAIGDINSDLYTSGENFNTAVNGSITVLNDNFETVVDNIANVIGNLIDTISSIDISIKFEPVFQDTKFSFLGQTLSIPTGEFKVKASAKGGSVKPVKLNNITTSATGGLAETLKAGMGFGSLNINKSSRSGEVGYTPAKTRGEEIASQIASSVKSSFREGIKNLTSGLSNSPSIAQVRPPKGSTITPDKNFGKNKSGGGSGGSGSKEADKADRYAGLNSALEQNNNLLKENDTLLSKNKQNLDAVIPLIRERRTIEKDQQSLLHSLNEERRKERVELEKKLSGRGFKFEGTGDDRLISNINSVSISTKDAQQELERYIQLSGEIKNASAEWWDLQHVVDQATLSYEGLNSAMELNAGLMSMNESIISMYTDDMQSQLPFLQHKAVLMEQQLALVEDTVAVIEEERRVMEAVLKELGYTFAGEGMTRHISNLKNVGYTTEFAKEMVQDYINKSKELGSVSSQWNEIETAIYGATNALQLQRRELELYNDTVSHQLALTESQLQLANSRLQNAEKAFNNSENFDYEPYYQAMRESIQLQMNHDVYLQEQMSIQQRRMGDLQRERMVLADRIRQIGGQLDSTGNPIRTIEMSTGNAAAEFNALIKPLQDINKELREMELNYNKSSLALEQSVYNIEEMVQKSKEMYAQRQKDLFVQKEQAKQDELRLQLEREQEALRKAQEEERKRVDALNKQLQEYRDNLSAIHTIQEHIVAIIRKRGELEGKALDEAHNKELELAREKLDKRKKDYEDELDAFRKMVEEKLKALDDQYDEDDFLRQLRKEEEEARELKRQIYILSLDDSLQARNKKADLESQLESQEEKIADMKRNRERDKVKENLNEQLKNHQETTKNKQDLDQKYHDEYIKTVEERHKKEKEEHDKQYSNYNIYLEARKALESGYVKSFDGSMKDLTTAYMEFEREFGTGMGALSDKLQLEFVQALNKAQEGLKQLNTVGIEAMLRPNYEVRELTASFDALTAAIERSANAIKNFKPDMSGWKNPYEGLTTGGIGSGASAGGNPYGMSDSDLAKYTANKKLYEQLDRTNSSPDILNQITSENKAIRQKYNIGQDNHSYSSWLGLIDSMGGANNNLGMSNSEFIRIASNKYAYERAQVGGYGNDALYNWLNNENKAIRNVRGTGGDSHNFDQWLGLARPSDQRYSSANTSMMPSGTSIPNAVPYEPPSQAPSKPNQGQQQTTSLNSVRQTIVSRANDMGGTQYIWGAAKEGYGFDCSGLATWSYGEAGLDTGGRMTSNSLVYNPERHNMVQVPLSEAQPGDLLAWNNGKKGHVAIVKNDTQVIESTIGGGKNGVVLGERYKKYGTKYTHALRHKSLVNQPAYQSSPSGGSSSGGSTSQPKAQAPSSGGIVVKTGAHSAGSGSPSISGGSRNSAPTSNKVTASVNTVPLPGGKGTTTVVTYNIGEVDITQVTEQFSKFSEIEKQLYLNNKKAAEELAKQGKQDSEEFNRLAKENQDLRNKYGIEADRFNLEKTKEIFDVLTDYTTSTSEMLSNTTENITGQYTALGTTVDGYTNHAVQAVNNTIQTVTNSFQIMGSNLSSQTQAFAQTLQAQVNSMMNQATSSINSAVSSWRPPSVDLGRLDANFDKYNASDRLRQEAYDAIRMLATRDFSTATPMYSGSFDMNRLQSNLNNRSSSLSREALQAIEELKRLNGYADGGKITHTGLAMVHGSNSQPEWVFNNPQFHDLAKLVANYEPKIRTPKLNNVAGLNNIELKVDSLIQVEGNVTKDVLPDLRKAGKEILTELGRELGKNGIKRR